jgi:hypothetical protein
MSIHKKLIDFHKEFSGARKTGKNPHFKSEHFTLDDVVHATTPILNKLGLYVTHYVDDNHLVTTVADESGDSVSSRFPMQLSNNPQAMGSLVTYYKRYNLCALLNIAEADDDGNAAAAAAPAMADAKQLATLEMLADGDEARTDFIKKRGGSLTTEQAADIITRWTEHEEAA